MSLNSYFKSSPTEAGDADEGHGFLAWVLTMSSIVLCVLSFPLSMFFCVKVVQEYERAVIFRLGRLLHGGAKGPGKAYIFNVRTSWCQCVA